MCFIVQILTFPVGNFMLPRSFTERAGNMRRRQKANKASELASESLQGQTVVILEAIDPRSNDGRNRRHRTLDALGHAHRRQWLDPRNPSKNQVLFDAGEHYRRLHEMGAYDAYAASSFEPRVSGGGGEPVSDSILHHRIAYKHARAKLGVMAPFTDEVIIDGLNLTRAEQLYHWPKGSGLHTLRMALTTLAIEFHMID